MEAEAAGPRYVAPLLPSGAMALSERLVLDDDYGVTCSGCLMPGDCFVCRVKLRGGASLAIAWSGVTPTEKKELYEIMSVARCSFLETCALKCLTRENDEDEALAILEDASEQYFAADAAERGPAPLATGVLRRELGAGFSTGFESVQFKAEGERFKAVPDYLSYAQTCGWDLARAAFHMPPPPPAAGGGGEDVHRMNPPAMGELCGDDDVDGVCGPFALDPDVDNVASDLEASDREGTCSGCGRQATASAAAAANDQVARKALILSAPALCYVCCSLGRCVTCVAIREMECMRAEDKIARTDHNETFMVECEIPACQYCSRSSACVSRDLDNDDDPTAFITEMHRPTYLDMATPFDGFGDNGLALEARARGYMVMCRARRVMLRDLTAGRFNAVCRGYSHAMLVRMAAELRRMLGQFYAQAAAAYEMARLSAGNADAAGVALATRNANLREAAERYGWLFALFIFTQSSGGAGAGGVEDLATANVPAGWMPVARFSPYVWTMKEVHVSTASVPMHTELPYHYIDYILKPRCKEICEALAALAALAAPDTAAPALPYTCEDLKVLVDFKVYISPAGWAEASEILSLLKGLLAYKDRKSPRVVVLDIY